jgi:hypothetical protein
MAAGLGFKTFNTGDVLSAADVNGYLMQGVLVFASTAARDAAITAPAEGQFAFTKDTNSLFYYDGAAWVASGATGDIEGVTAGTGISGGGTSGTVTVTNSMATAIDAKGDLIGGTGADTFARLAVGANGTVLTADSAETTGLKWAAAGGASGLTLISSTTVGTAVASVEITGAFSSTYDNYLIRVSGIDGSTATNGTLTFGATTSGYYYSLIYTTFASNTVVGLAGSNQSSIPNVLGYNSSNGANMLMYVNAPNLVDFTTFYYQGVDPNTTGLGLTAAGYVNNTTQYTSFKITAATGTLTGGTVKVYGYQNS